MSNNNVIDLDATYYGDIDVDDMLQANIGALEWACIIGVNKDGKAYLASSKGDSREILWALEKAKLNLLDVLLNEDDENN